MKTRNFRHVRSQGRAFYLEFLEARQLLSTVAWTGDGNDNAWATAENWVDTVTEAQRVPSEDDDVLIPSHTTAEILITGGETGIVTVASLTVGPGSEVTFTDNGNYRVMRITGLFTIATEGDGGNNYNQVYLGSTINWNVGEGAALGPAGAGPGVTLTLSGGGSYNGTFESITSDTTEGATALADIDAGLAASGSLGAAVRAAALAGAGGTLGLTSVQNSTGSGPDIGVGIEGDGHFSSEAVNGVTNVDITSTQGRFDVGVLNAPPNGENGTFAINGSHGTWHVSVTPLTLVSATGAAFNRLDVKRMLTSVSGVATYQCLTTSEACTWVPEKTANGTRPKLQYNGASLTSASLASYDVNPFTVAYTSNILNINTGSESYKLGFCIGIDENKAQNASCLQIDGTVALTGDPTLWLRVVRISSPPEGAEEYMLVEAFGGITSYLENQNSINGADIGLESDTTWRIEIRDGGNQMWLVKNVGT